MSYFVWNLCAARAGGRVRLFFVRAKEGESLHISDDESLVVSDGNRGRTQIFDHHNSQKLDAKCLKRVITGS